MGNLTLYSVNIAMESTMLFVLIILLMTLFWQKNLFATTIPLIFLTSFIIINLVVQIVTWLFLLQDGPTIYGAMPERIIYVLDYIFSYGASCAFYYYVEALGADGYKQSGIKYTPNTVIKKLIVIWGVVSAMIYMVALFMPSVYRLENGVAIYSITAYIGIHVVAKFAYICAVIYIIRHRKVIEKQEIVLSLVFLIVLSILVVIDELFSLCIGHVAMAIFTFILYVSIDLHKGLLLERREREIVEWKTQIMLSQMQPHFLYNVLTTISSMCEVQNATQARDVVNRFADYFRANLDSLGKEKMISFEKELEHIKTYLWLEKIRFEDALDICYEIGPTNFVVPSLTIQPMVENAVKHGILPKEDGGTITIKTYETDLYYVIVVEDDGVGFDANDEIKDTREHIGIENVSRRLEIICNGTCNIQSQKGEGTIVTIHIPKGE